MITLRLDPQLEKEVGMTARNLGLTKSELIRKSIIDYLGKLERPSAWIAGKDLFGRHASGKGNLSTDRKSILKEKLRAKRT